MAPGHTDSHGLSMPASHNEQPTRHQEGPLLRRSPVKLHLPMAGAVLSADCPGNSPWPAIRLYVPGGLGRQGGGC